MPRQPVESFRVERLQVLDQHGHVDRDLEPKIPGEDLQRLYRTMLLTRQLERRMVTLQQQGRIGTFAGVAGQEATSLGCVYALRPDDWLVPSFRETSGLFWRGVTPKHILSYFMGLEEGNAFPESSKATPIAITIGAQTLHGVGIAWAAKLRGDDAVALVFFGDGATSEGDFHEACNFAGVFQVPAVLVCVNNQYAISVPREQQTHSKTLAQKAIAYGFPGLQVDGNDILGCYVAAKEAIDRARAGKGPTLIEALTYRLCAHTTADDPRRYRTEAEVEEWQRCDPLLRFQVYLKGKGLWSPDWEEQLLDEIKEEIEEGLREAEAAFAQHEPLEIFDQAYAEPPPEVQAQKEQAAESMSERVEHAEESR
jgi:pyruvate dehydrogenase E1 component alpha subunit